MAKRKVNTYRRNLIRQVAKNRKRIEKQFNLLSEKGMSHEFEKAQQEKFRLIEMTAGSIRQPTRMSNKALEKVLDLQKKTMGSKFFTLKGRQEVANKSYETLKNRAGFEGFSKSGFTLFAKMMSDKNLLESIKEKFGLSSEQVLELARNYTEADITNAFNTLSDFINEERIEVSSRQAMALAKGIMAGRDIRADYERLQRVQSLGSN